MLLRFTDVDCFVTQRNWTSFFLIRLASGSSWLSSYTMELVSNKTTSKGKRAVDEVEGNEKGSRRVWLDTTIDRSPFIE